MHYAWQAGVRRSSVSFPIRLDARGQRRRSYETTPKWHGFLMIKLAAPMAWIEQRPQNFEGWFRFAQSFFKIDRIHHFDIRHSLFDIRFFRVSFSIRLAVFRASGAAY
jgi:hypothetical protein